MFNNNFFNQINVTKNLPFILFLFSQETYLMRWRIHPWSWSHTIYIKTDKNKKRKSLVAKIKCSSTHTDAFFSDIVTKKKKAQ